MFYFKIFFLSFISLSCSRIYLGSYDQVIFDEMEEEIPYKEGGTQYVSPTLKRAEDIRLYGSY